LNIQVFTQQALQHPSVVRIFGVVAAGPTGNNCIKFAPKPDARYDGRHLYFPAIIMGEIQRLHYTIWIFNSSIFFTRALQDARLGEVLVRHRRCPMAVARTHIEKNRSG
jgi:hypothetical protein